MYLCSGHLTWLWKITICNGRKFTVKYYTWPFSIAMLNFRRVSYGPNGKDRDYAVGIIIQDIPFFRSISTTTRKGSEDTLPAWVAFWSSKNIEHGLHHLPSGKLTLLWKITTFNGKTPYLYGHFL